MGIRYVFALNVSRASLDAVNIDVASTAIRNGIAAAGFGINGPLVTKNVLSSVLGSSRGNLVVGFNIAGDARLTPANVRAIDAAIVNGLKTAGRLGWSTTDIVRGLPSQGDGNYRPSWFGDVTDVQREYVSGEGIPGTTTTHPTATSVVSDTNDGGLSVGASTPSGLRTAAGNGLQAASDFASENKGLIIGGVVVIGLVAVAAIVVKVK